MYLLIRLHPPRGILRRTLRTMQAGLFILGVVSVCAFAWLQFERYYFGYRYLKEFDRSGVTPEVADIRSPAEPPLPVIEGAPAAKASAVLTAPSTEVNVLGRLHVERLGLEAPVLEGVDNRALRRGAGWIPGTARPGEPGNVGIAAHRDTFFRPLRDVRSGDRIRLDLANEVRTYVVRSVYIVEPEFAEALAATEHPTLTLVTCFPFDFVGPAPRRFIVQAVPD